MKKKLLVFTMIGMMTISAKAQVYAYDSWMQMPTADLYDPQVMNMAIRAQAEMAAKRREAFEYYSDEAIAAFQHKEWGKVIYNTSNAMEYSDDGALYFMRGVAHENLRFYKDAKKDYRKSAQKGFREAKNALIKLEEKIKEIRKKNKEMKRKAKEMRKLKKEMERKKRN